MTTFDKLIYREAFEQFRKMSDEIFDSYFTCLQIPDLVSGRALDVGAGPGISTEMLLSRLPPGWTAVALEPSAVLGAAALTRFNKFGSRVSLVRSRLEELRVKAAFDVAWMSEVVHLLGEVSKWAGRLATVMSPGGRVLIRTSTHSQLKARHWYRYFPSALEIDLARHPTRDSVLSGLAAVGFVRVSALTIDESRLIPGPLFLSMMRSRAFSTLHDLSEAELERGLHLLRSDLDNQAVAKWHYEMTAYTATFLGGASSS